MKLRLFGYLLVAYGFFSIVVILLPSLKGSGLPFAPPLDYMVLEDTGERVSLREKRMAMQEMEFFHLEKMQRIFTPLLLMLAGALILDFSKHRKSPSTPANPEEETKGSNSMS